MRRVFAGVLVLAAWLLGAQIAVAQPGFTPVFGSPFATGAGPQSVASGGPLIVTADSGANDLAVFNQDSEVHTGPFVVPTSRVGTGLAPASIAISSNGTFVAVANRGDNTVSMFSVSNNPAYPDSYGLTPVPGAPFAAGAGPQSVAFSPDGRLLAVANRGDNTVSMFSVSSGGSLAPVPGSPFGTGSNPQSVAFNPPDGSGSPGGEFLAVANSASNNVSMFSVTSAGSLAPVPGSPFATGGGPQSVAFNPPYLNPGGAFLAVANSASNNVSMFSVSSGGSLAPVPGSPFGTGRTPLDAEFGRAPGEQVLATANFTDNDVSVFSVSSSGALAPVIGSPLSLASGSGPASLTFGLFGLLAVANSTTNNISVFKVQSCNTQFNEGFNPGFDSGYNSGFTGEYRSAYRPHGSWQVGWKRGLQAARRRRRHAPRASTQAARPAASPSSRQGALPAVTGCDPVYNEGFNQGFNPGFKSGFNAAFNLAFRKGFRAGLAKGRRHK